MTRHTTLSALFLIVFLLPTISNASIKANKENKENANNFMVITDIHLAQATSHTMNISPSAVNASNDLDTNTFEKLITKIDQSIKDGVIPQPKFILILGDISGHLQLFSSQIIKNESLVFKSLKTTFPQTPIFYTFGNNDSLQTNYGPFTDTNESDTNKSPYDIAESNGGWINGFLSTGTHCENKKDTFPCILTENTIDGYYSAYLAPKLRLISLNTVLFSPKRNSTTERAATDELQWLKIQLKTAQINQESVLITMHIPPGNNVYDHSNFWLPKEQTDFLALITQYQKTIIGLLASHTHAEELKIIQNSSNKIITGVYLVAALSTSHGNEPSIKTFYLSQSNQKWLLSNYDTFHFSMGNSTLLLNKLYDYKNYYCADSEKTLLQCLSHVTANKMKQYFSAGNPNYSGVIKAPEDIILE